MSRRKQQPEQFDVVEFLRESDGDLKSALNSLLRSSSQQPTEANSAPGLNLTPVSILVEESKDEDNAHRLSSERVVEKRDNPSPSLGSMQVNNGELSDVQYRSSSNPGLKLIPGPLLAPLPYSPNLRPEDSKISAPEVREPNRRKFPIREMKLAQDAHTRAEQQVYEYLWQNAKAIDETSRTITIGFGAMARVVRLSESNARINVRNLIAKLAMEEFGEYNCEKSIGRTYRVFNYSEVLKRRREAGLLWYMRRTLAVVFVNPNTGQPIDLGARKQTQQIQPGANLSGDRGPNLEPAPTIKLGNEPGINLSPLYREGDREEYVRETPSSDSLLFETLTQYGLVDDDVIKRLRKQTLNVCPDFTDEELIHFIHFKGQLIRRVHSGILNPMGFLLTSVPKCFVGESFQIFRKTQREAREKEAADRVRREAEFENWRREQESILDDPNASEEDKVWARKMLNPEETS